MKFRSLSVWITTFFVVCDSLFAGIGLVQLIQRKNLFKVDFDILVLGIYYILVIFGYLIFEIFEGEKQWEITQFV